MIRWYYYGLASAVIVALFATMLALAGFAPIGVFSLCIGIAIGWSTTRLAKTFRICGLSRLWTGTVVFALSTVVAQHAWLYLDYCQEWKKVRMREPALAIFKPESWPMSPVEYFRLEATSQRVALWFMDAALTVAGAAIMLLLYQHRTDEHKRAENAGLESNPPTPDP